MGREFESPFLAMTIDYSKGGSITSLRDVRNTREWVVAPREPEVARVPGDFSTSGFAGWDEMLPTIVGDGLPDHGDIWSQAWREEESDDCRTVGTVMSPHSGLTLKRTIRLHQDEPAVTLHYQVVGNADDPVPFLWAAHPLFVADEDTTVSVEPEVSWWRTDPLPEGEGQLPDAPLRGKPAGWTGKWWSAERDRVRRVTLRGSDDRFLTIDLGDESPVAWLGVWADNGRFSPVPTIALEPAIGWCDDLHRAIANDTAGYVSLTTPMTWELVVRCG